MVLPLPSPSQSFPFYTITVFLGVESLWPDPGKLKKAVVYMHNVVRCSNLRIQAYILLVKSHRGAWVVQLDVRLLISAQVQISRLWVQALKKKKKKKKSRLYAGWCQWKDHMPQWSDTQLRWLLHLMSHNCLLCTTKWQPMVCRQWSFCGSPSTGLWECWTVLPMLRPAPFLLYFAKWHLP